VEAKSTHTRDPSDCNPAQDTNKATRTGDARPITRLAPSPTGALHLGNVRTFLMNAALAKQRGWRTVLRIEDIDSPRVKHTAIDQTVDVLSWLGLTWEGSPVIQSSNSERHMNAMRTLASLGVVYPSAHSRADVESAASAPHAGEHELRFPESLRPESVPRQFRDTGEAWRLLVDEHQVTVSDGFAGLHTLNPGREVGDFVVWTKRGAASYQLAVVVDDAAQGVTDIVRGDDLLPSTARQILLMDRLGIRHPNWWHVPLVLGSDGRRLAKRHGDTRITAYRQAGVTADRIIGLCAWWSGVCGSREPMDHESFCGAFSLDTLPHRPVHFTPEDHAWLLDG